MLSERQSLAAEYAQLDLDGREIAQERPQEPRDDIPAGPAPRLFDAPRTMRGQIALDTDAAQDTSPCPR